MTPVRWKGLLVIFKTMRASASWDDMTGSWVFLSPKTSQSQLLRFGYFEPNKLYLKHQCRGLTLPKGFDVLMSTKVPCLQQRAQKKIIWTLTELWIFPFLGGSPFRLTNFIHKHVSTKISGRNWTSRRYRKLKDFFWGRKLSPKFNPSSW